MSQSGPEPRAPLPRLSIIVPVFNEVDTVAAVVLRLRQVELPLAREILVVDDGSTDGTREILDGLERVPEVAVVHAPSNAGKGSAIRLGLRHARGTIVAIQDADLELDPAQLSSLVQPILSGRADVVYGSRFLRPGRAIPLKTLAANRVLTVVTNLLYGGRLTDMETCYKVMRMELARDLKLVSDGFDIEPEITAKLLRSGHRIHEVAVRFEPRSRAAGKKIGWRDGVQALRTLLIWRVRNV